jgi:hypothetical protein
MKIKHLLVSLVLGLGSAMALPWLLNQSGKGPPVVRAASYTVCPAGPPACDYSSIQAALDAASDGDVVKVAAGTYTDVSVRPRRDVTTTGVVTQVVYINKAVTVRGGYTTTNGFADPPDPHANPTTLDAQGQGRVLYITGDISPTVEGLRIVGGNDRGQGGGDYYVGIGFDDYGGGVYIITAAVTISNSQVLSNTGHDCGGGLCLVNSEATLSNNIIAYNTAASFGGGLCLVDSGATLSGNSVVRNSAGDFGGGLSLWRGNATLGGNAIISNTADAGGGLLIEGGDTMLSNNVVADNRANSEGSGLCIWGAHSHLLHTTIARNSGGDGSGLRVDGSGTRYSSVVLTNTVLVSHGVGISITSGNTVTVDAVLWHSTPVTISYSADASVTVHNQCKGAPAFAADGYHLTRGSAAVDRGVNAGVATDIDGEPRPAGANPDLGADELWYKTYLPVVLRSR